MDLERVILLTETRSFVSLTSTSTPTFSRDLLRDLDPRGDTLLERERAEERLPEPDRADLLRDRALVGDPLRDLEPLLDRDLQKNTNKNVKYRHDNCIHNIKQERELC